MKTWIKFGGWLLALGIGVGMALPCVAAQRPRVQFAQQKPPKPSSPPRAQNPRPATRPQQQPPRQQQPRNENRPPNPGNNPSQPPQSNARPQGNGFEGERAGGNARLTPRQQLGVGSPRPWVDQMRSLPPQQRERVLQNSRAFQNMPPEQQNKIRQQFGQWDKMSPQQRVDQQSREETWRKMTPEQRDHIKNDVLPSWRQMPQDRKRAISQRLSVLQNMPESARNQRLNDPEFTRGMSEEDKATLKDLSHLHVGGPPDPPSE
jgi:hypothetical protein